MPFITVDVSKLPKRNVALANYLRDLNAHRETPVEVVMYVEDDMPQGLLIYAKCGHLIQLYVKKEIRRSGVGKILHTYFVNETKGWEWSTIIHPENAVGMQFLLSQGWRVHRQFLPHNSDIWHLRMTRKPTDVNYQPAQEHLAAEDFLESAMVFFSVGGKLY